MHTKLIKIGTAISNDFGNNNFIFKIYVLSILKKAIIKRRWIKIQNQEDGASFKIDLLISSS